MLKVHGFRPNSRAEKQGLIKVNDEILSVNAVDVEGKVSILFDPFLFCYSIYGFTNLAYFSPHVRIIFSGPPSTGRCIGQIFYGYRSKWRS